MLTGSNHLLVPRPSSRDLFACAYLTCMRVRHVVLSHSRESYVPYHAIKMSDSSRLVVTGACALQRGTRTAPRDVAAPSLRWWRTLLRLPYTDTALHRRNFASGTAIFVFIRSSVALSIRAFGHQCYIHTRFYIFGSIARWWHVRTLPLNRNGLLSFTYPRAHLHVVGMLRFMFLT